jgi:hypothetical protein
MKSILIFLALALLTLPAFAQKPAEPAKEPMSGMIYGPGHSYMLTAPKGWVLDSEGGRSDGLQAVFYPEGSSWAKGAAVMYTNVLGKSSEKQPLKEVMDGELAEFRKVSPNLKVTDGKAIDLGDKKSAAVKYLTGDSNGSVETIAYINEKTVVVIVVLTSRDKKEFDSSLPAFEELVRSYSFLTDKVTVEK